MSDSPVNKRLSGRPYQTIDNLGRINETFYDAAGRTWITNQNYVAGGTVYGCFYPVKGDSQVAAELKPTDTDEDVVVKYDYDSSGRLATMVAYDANGTSVTEEATKYLYGSPVNASWQTAVVYPDSTDTVAQDGNGDWTITAGADHTSTTYDWLGQTTSTTDQRGVVHSYVYDSAGRVSYDTVTSFGSGGVDSAVQSIGTSYDDMGRVKEVTSYSGVIENAGGQYIGDPSKVVGLKRGHH